MTDPERISHRSSGLAAELLRAGATEQPHSVAMERTLAALGVSGALLTSASAAGAVVAGAGAGAGQASGAVAAAAGAATGVKAVKAVSGVLLVKWIGVGVLGGVGLAGTAAVVSEPAAPVASTAAVVSTQRQPAPKVQAPAAVAVEPVEAPEPQLAEPVAPRLQASNTAAAPAVAEVDLGTQLAAEVAFIDRARAALAAGQADQGLSQLAGYEREFPEARLLPEVLFLRLETCERVGRKAEARAAAQRLVDGFPKSPHAARARQLLGQ